MPPFLFVRAIKWVDWRLMFVMDDNGWQERSIFNLERQSITEGGIKERMHAARSGYRERVDSRLSEQEENRRLRTENDELRRIINSLTTQTSGTS